MTAEGPDTAPPPLAAELVDVNVLYPSPAGPVAALSAASLTFSKGTSTAITGRSGSGKSTLVSVLSMLRRPTSGTVRVDGRDTAGLSARETAILRSTRIGVVFQSFHLENSLTAVQNVMLPWYFRRGRTPRADARARAMVLLEELGIADLAERRPQAMSGGQRQRVAIGRAMYSSPALFLADEPTGNLDEETAGGVASVLLALPVRFDTAVVVVTHDTTIAAMADRSLHITKGRIAETAPSR